ncbi:MAG: cupin domain-containing protein [Proteobacteria bacterium]|nr:cupin domain-containing protein [Pseudomonadota bacterium]
MSNTETAQPLIVQPGSGEIIPGLAGDMLTIKIDGDTTGGRSCVFEVETPPGGGTPLHRKTREDELFFVLEGRYEFQIGESTVQAMPGSLLLAPRNVARRCVNVGATKARYLSFFTPAGIENMSRESRSVLPRPPDVETLLSKYGIVRAANRS